MLSNLGHGGFGGNDYSNACLDELIKAKFDPMSLVGLF